jgi:hypothetical protein
MIDEIWPRRVTFGLLYGVTYVVYTIDNLIDKHSLISKRTHRDFHRAERITPRIYAVVMEEERVLNTHTFLTGPLAFSLGDHRGITQLQKTNTANACQP